MVRAATHVLVFVLLAVACVQPAMAGFIDDMLENVVGAAVVQGLKSEPGLSTNVATHPSNGTFLTILKVAGQNPSKYQFGIVNDRQVNAFAAPGNQVFVTEGILEAVQGQDQELAFCLGHEVSHILNGDTKSLARIAIGTSLVGKVITNQEAIGIATRLLTYKQSQKDEFRADDRGMYLLWKSGQNLSGGLALMRRLETVKATSPSLIDMLFATHPPTPERSARLKDRMLQLALGSDYKAYAAEGPQKLETGFVCPTGTDQWGGFSGWLAGTEGHGSYDPNKMHLGRDIEAYVNPGDSKNQVHDPVYAVADGDIIGISKGGWDNGTKDVNVGIIVEHRSTETGPFWAVYGHVRYDSLTMGSTMADELAKSLPTPNQKLKVPVKAGELLGKVGPWYANGYKPHLHFGVIPNAALPPLDGAFSGWGRRSLNWEGVKKWPEGRPFDDPILWLTSHHPVNQEALPPAKENGSLAVQAEPIHLGDDTPGSRMVWFKEFSLDAQTLSRFRKCFLTLQLMATPRKDPKVWINRQYVGQAVARTGDWETWRFPVPEGCLKVGNNLIDLETVIAEMRQTYDDCEVQQITLEPAL